VVATAAVRHCRRRRLASRVVAAAVASAGMNWTGTSGASAHPYDMSRA